MVPGVGLKCINSFPCAKPLLGLTANLVARAPVLGSWNIG
tara:strand:+ start:4455 stop:4574 length:120 start_codon:yes stop_codon:yes gene_type:complete